MPSIQIGRFKNQWAGLLYGTSEICYGDKVPLLVTVKRVTSNFAS